jgi:type IV pilus assembly protein PilC
MRTYTYKVKEKGGRVITGTMVGEDRGSVASRLQQMGHYVMEIKETRGERGTAASWNPFSLFARWIIVPIFGGASIAQLAVFYRQFATMLRSGMAISQAMSSLRTQGGSRVLRKVAGETLTYVNNGGKLSDSLAQYPWIFPELHVSLIRAGETGGSLESMVSKIADYLERENKIRQRLRFATFYPKLLVLAVIFIPNAQILLFEGGRQYLHATMGILFPILAVTAGLWVGFRLLTQIPPVKYTVDMLKLAFPKLGKTVRMLALAKFYRVLGAMYAAGTPLSRGLKSAAGATGNWYITKRLQTAAPIVDRGGRLSDALRGTGILPGMALDMISTGEQTGNMDQMLEKAAEYTEEEAEVAVFQSTMVLGVLLIVVVAGYIGWYVIRFYMGQYANVMTPPS